MSFPSAMNQRLEEVLSAGPAGLVVAAWRQEEYDTGSRVEFVIERHRHGPSYPVGDSALAVVLGPLRAPAETEALGHRVVEDLRTLDLFDDDDATPRSSWVVAVATSRHGDETHSFERFINHALYEAWLYRLNQLSIFDDEDRPVLEFDADTNPS